MIDQLFQQTITIGFNKSIFTDFIPLLDINLFNLPNNILIIVRLMGIGVIITLGIILWFVNKQRIALKRTINDSTYYQNLLKTFVDADENLIYLKDENFKYIFANHAMYKFFNKQEEEIIGKSDYDLFTQDLANLRRISDVEAIKLNKVVNAEIEVKNKVYRSIKFPVKLPNNKIGVGAYVMDITEKRSLDKEIEYLSYHDTLTGLYNRRFFEEELKRLDTVRSLPLTVVMGDVNGLKLTNDVYGHQNGDFLLQKTASILKQVCRVEDISARWGGDEFIILLPNTDEITAISIIQRINKEMANLVVKSIKGQISLGSATKTVETENINHILAEAEKRMYEVKVSDNTQSQDNMMNDIMNDLHQYSENERIHSERVSRLIEVFGNHLSLSSSELIKLKRSGYLHDIGKVTLDKTLLDRIFDLTPLEWDQTKDHVITGYRILKYFNSTVDIADIVLSHHENWDGSGYPQGLKGDEIPYFSRIIAIVGEFERHIQDTKNPLTVMESLNEIKKLQNIQFDPQLVEQFEQVINRYPTENWL